MKFILLTLLSITILSGQTQLDFNKDHRAAEAERKARALEKQRALLNDGPQAGYRGYDVNYYGLTLDIYPENHYMAGSVKVQATATRDDFLQVLLDFSTYLTVDSIRDGEQNLTYTHNSGGLRVTLDKSYATDESLSFTVFYHGRTDFGGSSIFGLSFGHTTVFGKHHIWSLSEPYGARDWWPCKDTALDKPDSMDIVYIVPEGMTAASNGNLISEETVEGRTTFSWKVNYPIATYLVSIAAYEYSRYDDFYVSQDGDTLPILFFVAPQNLANTKANFELVNDMIEGFADMYGEYPFMGEKYGHAEASISGGMEHQTMTTLGPIQYNQGFYGLGLIAHELAHMWWGDMITCASFEDIWLNEGFATYSEALIQEKLVGPEAYKAQMELEEYYGPGSVFCDDTTNSNRIFSGNLSYSKGSYVLHMLRGVVGDSTFFNILKAWYDNPQTKYGAAYTKDFQEVCEQVSGISLEKFFQQWIYGEYYPVYANGFTYQQIQDGYNIELVIDQIQENTGLFWMPIDVQVSTVAGDTLNFVVWDSLATQTFNLFVEDEPLNVVIDPDKWILKETRSKLIDPALDKGLLLVNGLGWNISGVKEAYQEKAFWGDAPLTFWDLFDAPQDGYPESLPEPAGNGPIPLSVIGKYSTVIWLSNKSGGDFETWQSIPWIDYLNHGGNLIFMSRTGQNFIGESLRDYLGITWDENELTLVRDFISTNENLVDIDLSSNMVFISAFDTLLTKETSTLLFKTVAEQEEAKGTGVRSNPAEGGDFVYLAARPWQLNPAQLRTNMTYMLSSYMGEPVTSVQKEAKPVLPDKFEITNIYPNPFNPSTKISFTLPEQADISLTVFDVLGKKVATLLKNKNFKAGKHSVTWQANGMASGMYFIQLDNGSEIQTRKTILMQ